MKKILFACLLASLFLSPSYVFAETYGKRGQFEIAPYGGFAFPDTYGPIEPQNSFLAGLRLGYWFSDHFTIEVAGQRNFSEVLGGVFGINMDSVRGNIAWNFLPEFNLRPFLTVGAGWERFDSGITGMQDNPGYNAGAGLRGFFSKNFGVRWEGRYGVTDGGFLTDVDYQHNFEGQMGLFFLFPMQPAEIPPITEVASSPSCPPAPVCPSLSCDGDADGVADEVDRCLASEKGVKVDESGCAVDYDSDGDGVLDSKDKCHGTPAGTQVDASGCTAMVKKARGVLQGVQFVFGSADLTTEAKKVLNGIAAALKEVTDGKIEVQGHTDDIGNADVNRRISEVRASSVVNYLVEHGVRAALLTWKGYGGSMPIDSRKTAAARAKNRRVELKWLE